MSFEALVLVSVCCIAWMTRPGQRPQFLVLDILPWLCVAGFVIFEGVAGLVFAWAAVPLIYFSIAYNHLDAPVVAGGPDTMAPH
jgi:hypothetical protein